MRYCKVRRFRRYDAPKKLLYPEKYAQHLLLSLYLFRDKMSYYQNNQVFVSRQISRTWCPTVVNNKVKFEPYDDLLYDVYSHYNVNISDNQDPCG